MRLAAQDYERLRRDKALLDGVGKEKLWLARSDEKGRVWLERHADGKDVREALHDLMELSAG